MRYVYSSESSITTSAAFVLISEPFKCLALFTCIELTKYLFESRDKESEKNLRL